RATGKKTKCLLGVEARAGMRSRSPDDRRHGTCRETFSVTFATVQKRADCGSSATVDDVESAVDAFVADLVSALETVPTTTSTSPTTTTTTTATTTITTPTTTTIATTTTTTTTTTTSPSVCGDGVIEGSEECDGDAVCNSSCLIDRYACCQYGSEPSFCS